MTDVFSREKRSCVMSKIRSKDTEIERNFFSANPKAVPHPKLPYHPDAVLKGEIVFLDSPFWHGKVPQERYERLPPYWREKLFRNMVRDCCADAFYGVLGNLVRVEI